MLLLRKWQTEHKIRLVGSVQEKHLPLSTASFKNTLHLNCRCGPDISTWQTIIQRHRGHDICCEDLASDQHSQISTPCDADGKNTAKASSICVAHIPVNAIQNRDNK